MSGRPLNSDAGIASELFGVSLAQGTGAPGSAGIDAAATNGPEIGRPVVSAPFGSSQLEVNRPTVAVLAGDTSGMSDDLAAHVSAIEPGPQSGYLDTGSGSGHTITTHPNAGR